MRASYDSSFATLQDRVEIIGSPRPDVSRVPRHDDEEPGPSIFRLRLEDVGLTDLTLPGLYIARSELRRVSFRNSDLHLSGFNWSDFLDCDFTAADLSRSDLRACRFTRCMFRAPSLALADLRGSTFSSCSFDEADMHGTILFGRRRWLGVLKIGHDHHSLPLSAQQRAHVSWSAESEMPGGG